MNWKILAIILLTILSIEHLYLGFVIYRTLEDEKKSNICYYDICEGYDQADYDNKICTCYEFNPGGKTLSVAKTKFIE